MDLVKDFIEVADRVTNDLKYIIENEGLYNPVICVVPHSKAEKSYLPCQLMFKKAISSVVNNLDAINGSDYIKRLKNT